MIFVERFSGSLDVFGFMVDLKKHKSIILSDFLFWPKSYFDNAKGEFL